MGPQSTALFLILMVAFCALLVWVAIARQPVFRVFAAALAFVPAMLFGVAAVNKYYDYYQTWTSVAADLGGQGVASAVKVSGHATKQRLADVLGQRVDRVAAEKMGKVLRVSIPGPVSRVTRTVYVYLPPQYFQPAYAHYQFPAIELFQGFPGEPQDWINVVGITDTFQTLLADNAAQPAVLVMPDTNGGPRVSLQCLNVHHGIQDATYLAVDLPHALSGLLHIQPPGDGWGAAGYSEGGYCAANLALVYPTRYGFSGVLSGYFAPSPVRFGSPPHMVDPFAGNRTLRLKNTPTARLAALRLSVNLPLFWLGAGSGDKRDVRAAIAFQRLLLLRQPDVQLHIAPGGAHNMITWRALIPPLLEWMTPRLAAAALHIGASATPSSSPSPGGLSPGGAVPSGKPTPSGRPSSRSLMSELSGRVDYAGR